MPKSRHPLNNIACKEFSPENLKSLIRAGSGYNDQDCSHTQIEYLSEFLEDLGAKSLVVEERYIDRHFIEEYALYYARCLGNPRNYCHRIHAFSSDIDDSTLHRSVERCVRGERKRVEAALNRSYLGFIVVRPIPSVPVGRTILKPLQNVLARHVRTTTRYKVHLLGLELRVDGLAFQQQDQAVAACATTAVWSALQRLCRNEGARPPTPSAITEAAAKHLLPFGRPIPSPGLNLEQISEALRSFEFAPHIFQSKGNFLVFKMCLHVYLRSGIPVILGIFPLDEGREGHAVAAVGYREDRRVSGRVPHDSYTFSVENLRYSKIYIHDDRVGPYARAILGAGEKGHSPILAIEMLGGRACELRLATVAIAPLYPKIRTTAFDLYLNAMEFFPLVRKILGSDGEDIGLELFFDRAGSYTGDLYDMPVDEQRQATFQREVTLSRYVGIARWGVDGVPLVDTIWDTTDRLRPGYVGDQLLGIVGFRGVAFEDVDLAAETVGVPAG